MLIKRPRIVLAALATLALVGLAIPANAQELFVFRAESIDAAVADIQTVVRAAGTEVDRELLLTPVREVFGITDTTLLDGKRPVIVTMPMTGMMMGPKGLVGVVPVTDAGKVLEMMAAKHAEHATSEGGLHTFSTEAGPAFFARSHEGFLVIGGNADLVGAFDITEALASWDGPPGNLGVELRMEQAAPMIQMSLLGIKQQMLTEMQRDLSKSGAELPFDPAKIAPLMDVYFGFIQSMLDNVERVQFSVEVGSGNVLVHERFVPKAESTFAGLVAAQKGPRNFPHVARMVEPGAMIVSATCMDMTPEFAEGAKKLVKGYVDAVFPLLEDMLNGDDPSGEAAPTSLEPLMAEIDVALDRHFRCVGRDSAGSFDMVPGQGMAMRQVYEWSKDPDCRVNVAEEAARGRQVLALLPAFQEFLSMGEGPTVSGVQTLATTVNLGVLLDRLMGHEPEAREALGGLYGESLSVMEAYGDGLYAMAMGGESQTALQGLLAGRRGKAKGLTADLFAPLPKDTVSYALFDVGRMLASIKSIVPEGELDASPEWNAAFDAFAGEAGRLRFGVGFDAGGATFHAAVPLATVEAIGKLVGVGHDEHEHNVGG